MGPHVVAFQYIAEVSRGDRIDNPAFHGLARQILGRAVRHGTFVWIGVFGRLRDELGLLLRCDAGRTATSVFVRKNREDRVPQSVAWFHACHDGISRRRWRMPQIPAPSNPNSLRRHSRNDELFGSLDCDVRTERDSIEVSPSSPGPPTSHPAKLA